MLTKPLLLILNHNWANILQALPICGHSVSTLHGLSHLNLMSFLWE